MVRIIAGIASIILATAGVALFSQGGVAVADALEQTPPPPETRGELPIIPDIPEPPAADPTTKEQARFNRVDKDRDDLISLSEIVHPRRAAFAKLDRDGNGELRFEEWAVSTIEKFDKADANGDDMLSRAEYASTAPKPRKAPPKCSC